MQLFHSACSVFRHRSQLRAPDQELANELELCPNTLNADAQTHNTSAGMHGRCMFDLSYMIHNLLSNAALRLAKWLTAKIAAEKDGRLEHFLRMNPSPRTPEEGKAFVEKR